MKGAFLLLALLVAVLRVEGQEAEADAEAGVDTEGGEEQDTGSDSMYSSEEDVGRGPPSGSPPFGRANGRRNRD